MSERESTGGAAVVVDPLGGLALDPPNELKFRGPFDDYVSVSLSIRNPTQRRIAFKIKTTAPKRYCVKPNSGVLDPDQSMKVNVLLQPFVYDPNEKNKHKFMVQYMYLNENEMQYTVNDILNMWKDVSALRLLDLKLKCIFEVSEADAARLAQQQNNSTTNAADESKTAANTTASNKSMAAADTTTSAPAAAKSNVSSTTKPSHAASASTASFNSAKADYALANDRDFESVSTTTKAGAATATPQRLDKNDNALNELKLARQENDALRKEINRLKEEESRLRKLALQAPSSSLNRSHAGAGGGDTLTDILNNRSTLIIIVLLAIVLYLLLFR